MKQLSLHLPPFAPDYSGVCSALFELGGMTVIHDACGCTGNYTGFDEPRWYGSKSEVYCSGLRQIDAILGDDEKLISRILQAAKEMHPKFICITGSPVPMVIGTDFEGVAQEVEQRYGAPAFGFSTSGLRLYDAGASDAFVALAKRMAARQETVAGSVNLLGLTPLDFYVDGNAESIVSEFEGRGWRVLCPLAMGASLQEVKKSAAAQVNVVVSQSGLAAAKYYYERFHIPYVVGLPVGKRAAGELFTAVDHSARDGQNRVLRSAEEGQKKHILIAGERVASCAIRRALRLDYGIEGVAVAGIFTPQGELAEPGDVQASCEEELTALLNREEYDVVVADPMLRVLIRPENKAKFVDFPIPAVSSKLHWEQCIPFIGEKIETLVQRI